jgi:predicted lipoprotein with Yx(FWY)xxD motif
MLKRLPTTLWLIGATVAVAAFSPVVGQVATSAPSVAAAPSPAAAPAPASPDAGAQSPDAKASPDAVAPSPEAAQQPPAATPQETQTQQPAETGEPAAAQVVIKAGATKLGPTAVDAEGHTLYMSVLDSTDPPKSVCLSRQCVGAWTPVALADGQRPLAGAGVDQAELGALVRPDKITQATLGGWPLYRFVQDQKPGDVQGEGLKGIWHAIGPDGKKAIAAR